MIKLVRSIILEPNGRLIEQIRVATSSLSKVGSDFNVQELHTSSPAAYYKPKLTYRRGFQSFLKGKPTKPRILNRTAFKDYYLSGYDPEYGAALLRYKNTKHLFLDSPTSLPDQIYKLLDSCESLDDLELVTSASRPHMNAHNAVNAMSKLLTLAFPVTIPPLTTLARRKKVHITFGNPAPSPTYVPTPTPPTPSLTQANAIMNVLTGVMHSGLNTLDIHELAIFLKAIRKLNFPVSLQKSGAPVSVPTNRTMVSDLNGDTVISFQSDEALVSGQDSTALVSWHTHSSLVWDIAKRLQALGPSNMRYMKPVEFAVVGRGIMYMGVKEPVIWATWLACHNRQLPEIDCGDLADIAVCLAYMPEVAKAHDAKYINFFRFRVIHMLQRFKAQHLATILHSMSVIKADQPAIFIRCEPQLQLKLHSASANDLLQLLDSYTHAAPSPELCNSILDAAVHKITSFDSVGLSKFLELLLTQNIKHDTFVRISVELVKVWGPSRYSPDQYAKVCGLLEKLGHPVHAFLPTAATAMA